MRDVTEIRNILRAFEEYKSFSIYTHMNTDFDALGASLCLKYVLEKRGKVAHVFVDSAMPTNVECLIGYEKINNEKLTSYDVAVVLDCGDETRLARNNYRYKKGVKRTINIDHHVGTKKFANLNYLVPGASSTCELLFDILKIWGVKIDATISRLLICGIYTDTGSLQFSNSQPSTFSALSELVSCLGCPIDEVTQPIFSSLSRQAFELKKLSYNKLELFREGKIAIILLEGKDFRKVSASFEDTEGLVNVGMQLEGVKLLALISEDPNEEGTFRISLRSKGFYSARNVALAFGGGGHIKAAGCRIFDTAENVKTQILKELEKELDRL